MAVVRCRAGQGGRDGRLREGEDRLSPPVQFRYPFSGDTTPDEPRVVAERYEKVDRVRVVLPEIRDRAPVQVIICCSSAGWTDGAQRERTMIMRDAADMDGRELCDGTWRGKVSRRSDPLRRGAPARSVSELFTFPWGSDLPVREDRVKEHSAHVFAFAHLGLALA